MRAGPGIGTETAFFIAADGPRVPRVGIHCDFPGLILFKQKMGHGPQCEGADAPVPESILPDEQIDPPDAVPVIPDGIELDIAGVPSAKMKQGWTSSSRREGTRYFFTTSSKDGGTGKSSAPYHFRTAGLQSQVLSRA